MWEQGKAPHYISISEERTRFKTFKNFTKLFEFSLELTNSNKLHLEKRRLSWIKLKWLSSNYSFKLVAVQEFLGNCLYEKIRSTENSFSFYLLNSKTARYYSEISNYKSQSYILYELQRYRLINTLEINLRSVRILPPKF